MPGEGFSSYLSDLNPEQLAAVTHEGSPLLILAGAGTGKTRVIISKIAYLIREKRIYPESILAVTFTNKAAREMRERASALDPRCERATIRTFHSFGAWLSRRYAASLGLSSGFVIYDDSDSTELLHSLYPQMTKQVCGRYASLIARAKDYMIEPDSPDLGLLTKDRNFQRIFTEYEARLRATGNVDFGDLIRLPTSLLASNAEIAGRVRRHFEVILVDEYQDSNIAQFQLLKNLVGEGTYLCVVGDDDQSIYRFRGAEVKNILNFPKVFAGTQIIRLERNYRSKQSILDLAGNIVSHNEGRLGKVLRSTKPGGLPPKLALLDDQEQEVEYCSSLIKAHAKSGGTLSDIAILYRTNAQSLSFEKVFPRKGIAYRIVGALRFYDREEVKDALAYCSLLVNPRDEISFRRVVNKPSRGIGDTSVDTVFDHASKTSLDLLESCVECADSLHGKGKAGAKDFIELIARYRGLLGKQGTAGTQGAEKNEADDGENSGRSPFSLIDGEKKRRDSGASSLGALVKDIVNSSGLLEYHKDKDEISGTQKSANLEELINAASEYPLSEAGLIGFLENIELDKSFQAGVREAGPDAVTLITMHNTKGLEFPIVVVTGLEQGLFPREEEEGEDLEEQRRLFYVAATRAKESLYLTACHIRRIHGHLLEMQPSKFLQELDRRLYSLDKAAGATASDAPRRAAIAPQTRLAYAQRPLSSYSRQDAARSESGSAKKSEDSSGWKVGMSVYHDEFGPGVVEKVLPSSTSGPLVVVRFETGKLAQFFPKYTKKLERTAP